MPEYQQPVVQFQIPKAAARALDRDTLAATAKAMGFTHGRFEYSEVSASPGKGRITCTRDVAILIIEALKATAESSSGQLVIDCAMGAKSALDAIDPHPERRV